MFQYHISQTKINHNLDFQFLFDYFKQFDIFYIFYYFLNFN